MSGRSSALLLGLLAGLFIAGAAAALLWPAEKPRTVAARSEAPAAPPAPPPRSAPVVRDVPRETARIAPPPKREDAPKPAPAAAPAAPVTAPVAAPAAKSPPPPPAAVYDPDPEPTVAEPTTLAAIPTVPPPATPPPAASGQPAWQRYAVAAPPTSGRPMIAIVLDDVGLNRPQSRRAIALPGPITLSFLTYAEDLPQQTASARAAGHELMLHVPMEPMESSVSPGPEALTVAANETELQRRLNWGLGRFTGFVGINNHMGSRFTQDADGMSVVLSELQRRGLLFLDSVTTGRTVGSAVAARYGVPFARRDVFLDHVQDAAAVRQSLEQLERKARAQGYAVGIGHPHPATIDVLQAWLPTLQSRGYTLVPLTAIVKRLHEPAAGRNEAAIPPPRG
ncbi:polysaccharide deacetylase 2 family uncharacterized protein YibQ [Constrictibacter sp. MBR-5]|uniref:divergent polysaccharide deacetylase family protein n=1 Tax=Constrictibacter sp. MBR-5 TaxID=3156467 RepID=UPI003393C6E5